MRKKGGCEREDKTEERQAQKARYMHRRDVRLDRENSPKREAKERERTTRILLPLFPLPLCAGAETASSRGYRWVFSLIREEEGIGNG